MLSGIGIDLIEVERIAQALQKTSGFKNRIFTAGEIAYCERQPFPEQHYAARFAAKEAFFKALGTGYRNGLRFDEIEVLQDPLGKPTIQLSGRCAEAAEKLTASHIHVALTHTAAHACAVVVIEKL